MIAWRRLLPLGLGLTACAKLFGIEEACEVGASGCAAPSVDAGALTSGSGDPCRSYCERMESTCTGDDAGYTQSDCALVCALFPRGAAENDNSVECRLSQVTLAVDADVDDRRDRCQGAGPGGQREDGVPLCGTLCESYCTLLAAACGDTFTQTFRDFPSCLASCATLPGQDGAYNTRMGDSDSVQCRVYHIANRLRTNDEEHCAHAVGVRGCPYAPAESAPTP